MKPAYINALLLSPIFSGFSENELKNILDLSEISLKMLEKGETVFTEKNFSRSLGIILKGSAKVEKRAGEKNVLINTLETGSAFGMATLFYEKENFPTHITAEKPTAIAFFSKQTLLSLFEKEPKICENYICLLSKKIHFLNKKIANLSGNSSYKLYSYLLDEYEKNGKNGKVTLKYNMSELASLLGVGRTSLYRELEALTDEGLIKKDGKVFTILKNN